MKLISWNVAGFRAVLKKGFEEFFNKIDADVFCIQESKVLEDQFDYRSQKEGNKSQKFDLEMKLGI